MTRIDHRLPFASSFSALLLIGCPSDGTSVDTGATESETTTGDGDGDGDGDLCGNGELDAGEACDDGNTDDGDSCSSTCEVSACGLAWSVAEGGEPDSNNRAFDVEIGDDGSIYVAGTMVTNTPGESYGWVAKRNSDGTAAWSQTYDGEYFNAIAVGAGGEIYVAGGKNGTDLWYAELSSADGSLVWDQVVDVMVVVGIPLATGIDITPDGDIVIVGNTRVDSDDDVWVRKADASDGTEIWTSLWSGTGDGMVSSDLSGPVSVADDGTIWVSAHEYVDFDSQEATILQFDANGTFVDLIQPQPAGNHQHYPVDILAYGGSIYFVMRNSGFPYHGWLYKLAPDGTEEWVKTEQDWIMVDMDITLGGAGWAIRGLGIDADGNLGLGGDFTNEGLEAWVAKLDATGEIICRSHYKLPDIDGLPSSLSIDIAGYNSTGFALIGSYDPTPATVGGSDWIGHFLP